MTSRHLYFNLLREDIKRKLWAAALLGLSLFFALPVAMMMVLTYRQPDSLSEMSVVIQERTSSAVEMLSFGRNYPMVVMILFCAAVVVGISSFSYLHNSKQVDFYHSLPVKRSFWFWVHISSGILITGAVYLTAIVLSLIAAAVNGVSLGAVLGTACCSFLCHMLCYCLVYITVVLVMILTGTWIAAVLGTVVFFSYFPAVCSMINAFCTTFLDTYYYGTPVFWRHGVKLSPVHAVISAVEKMTWGKAAGIVTAILILGACSFFLYQKRPSEAAGKTMAFSWSKGIIKVLLVLAFGMAGAMFFYAIRESLGWTVFGVIVGVVISHCVIEVIYYADFKKLFFHEKTMALCMAGVLLIVLAFYFDWFRFDSYVPDENKIAYSSIDFKQDRWVSYPIDNDEYPFNDNNYMLYNSRIEDSASVIAIAREAIRQEEEYESNNSRYYGRNIKNIVICYTLKSRRKVYRSYRIDLSEVIDIADKIYLNPEYKKIIYPGLNLETEEASGNMVYRDFNENIHELQGNSGQWNAVADAYKEDLMNLSFSKRRDENPIGEILLISDKDAEYLASKSKEPDRKPDYHRGWYDGYFYPIYPSFSRTIQALKQCGINAGLSADDVEKVIITAYSPFGEEELDEAEIYYEEKVSTRQEETSPYEIIYQEREEIERILERFICNENSWKNGMSASDSKYDITLVMKDRRTHGKEKSGHFQEKKVPDFVVSDFLEEEEKGG